MLTSEKVREMAMAAYLTDPVPPVMLMTDAAIERLVTEAYAAGAAAEREECAKVCDNIHPNWKWGDEPDSNSGPRECAEAIRARGEVKP